MLNLEKVKRILTGRCIRESIHTVLLICYSLSPLWAQISDLSMAVFTMAVAIILLVSLYKDNRFLLQKPKKALELSLAVVGVFALLGIMLYCMHIDIGYRKGYETEFWLLFIVLFYYCINREKKLPVWYLRIVLHSYSGILVLYLAENLAFRQVRFLGDKTVVIWVAGIAALLGVLHYCYNKEKNLNLIYLTETVCAFFVLAIEHHTLSQYVLFFSLLLAVICMPPRAEPVKRGLQMLFVYVFLLANMPLLVNYTSVIPPEKPGYSLEEGVLLDLFLSILGMYVLGVWDKLPLSRERDCILKLRAMQVNFLKMAAGFLTAVLFACLCSSVLGQLPSGTVFDMVKAQAGTLYQAWQEGLAGGILYQSFAQYGICGGFVCIYVIVLMAERVWDNHRFLHHENLMLTLCAAYTGIAVCIYGGSIAALSIPVFLLLCALIPDMQYVKRAEKD